MAAEFEQLAADFLRRLPEDHTDRPFLAGIHAAVAAYAAPRPAEPAPAGGPDAESPAEAAALAGPDQVLVPDAAATSAEQAEQERVRLSGRIGARPRFSTTPRGVRRAEFNLAVHEDDEATTWHTVLAFRERAERLEQANPQKGQLAEVIGYRRVEERTDRAGSPKTVARIIAAHIRLR